MSTLPSVDIRRGGSAMAPLLLTIPEAAAQYRISREMLYREIRAQRLPVVRIGRATRVPYEALARWAAERTETWDGGAWTDDR
jgi:excisionase family DNA binding protein